jgi:hypothetical protein
LGHPKGESDCSAAALADPILARAMRKSEKADSL